MNTYFKTKEGQHQVIALYDEKLQSLGIEVSEKTLETTFGKTHILVAGKKENPPLVLVHGSNGCAPIALESYPALVAQFQVFAIDVIAQPNKSEGIRPSMKDQSYGIWMEEILHKLNLTDVTLAGFSFGGLIILKHLIYNEQRIKEVFLAAPCYIVNGNPIKLMLQMFLPMRKYMRTQKEKYLRKFLDEVFTQEDPFALAYLSKVFIHFKMDFSPLPVISKKEAGGISTPITLFPAKYDLIFPGEKMARRSNNIFPSLKACIMLEHSKHVQSRKDNDLIQSYIINSNSDPL